MSWNPFRACANLWCFLVFFCLCYFLETITFTYLVSAVQSIERQFEIPSRMSGSLVAASDIGYVVTVVILAYLGSRGNRARWIGGGCLLIAVASFIVALPTFLFPPTPVVHNIGELMEGIFEPLTPEQIRTPQNYLNTMWGRRLPPFIQEELNKSNMPLQDLQKATIPAPHHPAKPFQLTTPLPFDDQEEGDDIEDPEGPLEGSGRSEIVLLKAPAALGKERDEKKVAKRQALNITVQDAHGAKMREQMEEVTMGFYWGFDNYTVFANKMFNITNNRAMPERLMASAGLPFGFCRNASMIVKARMKVAKCKHQALTSGNNAAFAIVFIGIMLIGVGHSMPWTLGMPMIDDNVKKQKTPYYFAGVFFVRIMGPVVGFLLGAICSKLYVTLKPAPPGITPLDPRWIGAWWLGFLVVFATLTIPSIILMCFPKFQTKEAIRNDANAKNNRTPQQNKNGEASLIDKETGRQNNFSYEDRHAPKRQTSVIKELKGFGVSLAQVIRSPIYTGALIGRLFDAFAFKGYFVFKPKYLENHYGLTQFKSSIYMGLMGVVGFAGGVVIGSLLMRKARLEGRKAAAYVGACSLIAAALSIGQTFLGCHSVVNQIGQVGVMNGNESHPVWSTCYGCNCDAAGLYPVCSRDGSPYYSPCHAGCTNFTFERAGLDVNFNFDKCSCVADGTGQVSRQWCKDDCETPLIIYLVFSTIAGVISGSAVIPGVLIVLRSVPQEHRSVALGFSGFIVSLISTFPSPPVYGLIIDTACIVWTTACGGSRGSCQIYDPKLFRQRIYIFQGALRVFALIFDVWVWYYAKNLKLMEEDEDQDQGQEAEGERPRHPPSFAREIEDEIKGLQVDGSDVLARKMSM